ncbi:glycerophosphodiester phosphodiesterase [Stappia taiwanensis]|uniref:Glycerophosphodiester phosphodiesterase n=1 Tax=Stappia taiwanensis TaxID=992267 RepID=A0A838XTX7_9HYPH|nr:glycerophosphodiester phosphodiesterase family protein [Stappia taiwanensis]MBA4612481.1 glycerophosphodiester phosphodiesterase [Stappia taiwanensis]GGF05679.1 glycerophosphoryl diester phosphodiesterase [Stappia taiwanensis]
MAIHPYLADHRFAALAHRGGGLENPENSRQAFAAVNALGYSFIEIDVQASSDGVVVVFHDDTLERTTDGRGVVSELPYEALRAVRIGGGEPLLTLEEALLTWPAMRFNIDIKTDQALEPTLDLLRKLDCLDRVCVASFSDRRLKAVRQALGPAVCLSSGPRSVAALKFGSWHLPFPTPDVDCAQVPLRKYGIPLVTPGFLRHCRARRIAVHVWTIDDEAEMRRLIRLGVDGIVTDRPSALKRVAQEEGVW